MRDTISISTSKFNFSKFSCCYFFIFGFSDFLCQLTPPKRKEIELRGLAQSCRNIPEDYWKGNSFMARNCLQGQNQEKSILRLICQEPSGIEIPIFDKVVGISPGGIRSSRNVWPGAVFRAKRSKNAILRHLKAFSSGDEPLPFKCFNAMKVYEQ